MTTVRALSTVFTNYNFEVTLPIQLTPVFGSFSEVTGVDATHDVVEWRTGDEQGLSKRKYRGLTSYGNITLSRGICCDQTQGAGFINWITNCINETENERASMNITLVSPCSATKITWQFKNVWPIKYVGPGMNALNAELAIERLELAHNGFERIVTTTTASPR